MKLLLKIFPLLFLLSTSGYVFSQSWERLINDGGSSGNEVYSDMHIDNEGNVYLTGSFSGSATFENTLLTSNGATDFFIVKYDSSGHLIYAINGGSTSADLGNAIVSDNNGNAYVTGQYRGFFTIAGSTLTITGPTDMFTVKVDTLGNFVWAKKAGGFFDFYGSTYQDRGIDIAFDNSNGIYVSGVTSGQSMTFGPFLHGPAQGAATDFVGKYDLNGNEQWIRSASDPNATFSSGFSLSTSLGYNPVTNSMVVAGYNNITVSIGGGGISKNSDLYFRQILPNGNFGWYRQFGGTAQEEVADISIDGAGNIYATGLYNGNLEIPLGSVIATSINDGQNSEVSDAFILKLNPNASSLNYVKLVSGSQDIDGLGIASNPAGVVYATGRYKGSPGVDNVPLNPKGEFDVFLLRIDTQGNLNWVEEAGGSGDDLGVNVDIRNDGKVILSGGFSSVAQFGNSNLTSLGFSDAFLANLDCKPGIPQLNNSIDTSVCIGDTSEIILDEKFGSNYSYNLLSGGTLDTTGNPVSINWTSSGNHQLEIIPTNICGQGKILTIEFEIQDVPGPSQIIGDTNICLGLGTYSAFNLEANSFNWSLSGGGSLVPLGNQTLVSWSSSGQYILSVSSSNVCGIGGVDSTEISVAQFPSGPILISGSSATCIGTDTFTINTQAETDYNWELSSGGVITEFDSFAIVTWTQEGSHIIQVTASNICGTGNASSKIVNVSTSPSNEFISGDSVVCLGSSSFSLPSINGALYNWNVSGGGILLNLGNTAIVNWSIPGDYFVTASIQNSCGQSEIDTFNIEVRSSAIQPGLVSGSNAACIGSENYFVAQQLNQTYEWSLSSGGNLNFVNNQASVNWTQTGFHTLTVTAVNDCGQGLSRDLVVEVKTVPNQPGVIFGDDEVCLGLENYNVFSESGITYNWSISGGGQLFPSNNSVSVNWTLDGNYDLVVTPSNQCGNGTSRILPIEVKDVPEDIAGIEGIDTVCLGNQIYSVINAQTGNDLSFNWSLSGGGIIAPNGNSATVTWNSPGDYTLSVRAQNQCGFGQVFSKIINVKNVNNQVLGINGDDLVCLDTSDYNVASILGFSYNWNLSGGGTLNASSNQAEIIWQNIGNYTLSVTSSDGCTKTLPIEVKDIPNQPSIISGDTIVCLGTTSYAVNPEAGQVYDWTLTGGGNISGFGNAAISNWSSPGVYNVEVSANNLCGTGPIRSQEVNVLTNPLAPVFISGDTLICKGQSENYILNSRPFETYSWALDRAGLINPSDTLANIQWLDTGVANITVSASNLCGTGATSVLRIDIDDVPNIPQIFGPTQVCLDTVLYTSDFDDNVNYNWSVGGTAILDDSLNFASISFSDTGNYNLNLNLTNSCGIGSPAQKNIQVFQIPSRPSLIQGDTIVCLGFSSYQVLQNQNETYTWNLSGGGTLNPLNNSATINWTNTGFHQIYIQATNLCGSGPVDTINVEVRTTPLQPSSIVGDVNVCLDNRQYAVNPSSNIDYAWSLSGNGNLVSGDSANASVNWTNTGVSVISVVASNLCGTSPIQSKSISISDIPALPQFISGDTLTCLGNEIYSIQPSAGQSYNWNLTGGGTITPNANQSTITWNQTGNWNLISSITNFCGTGPSDTLDIRVKTIPDTVRFINPDTLVCLGNISYTVSLEPEVAYNWSLNGGGNFSSVSNQAFVTWNTPGVYSLQVNPVNICGSGPSESLQVDVNSVPNLPQFSSTDTLSCIGTEIFTALPITNANFLWNLNGGGGSSSNGNQFTVNWTSTGVFDIQLSAFNFCGSSPINIKRVTVNDIPSKPILISGNTQPCLENEPYLVNSVNASNYTWSLSGGGILSTINDSAIVNWISPSSQIIIARGENYCGLSTALNINVDIGDVPVRPSGLIGSTSVCFGDSVSYSVLEEPGLTYQWRVENGDTISADSSAILLNWGLSGEQLILVRAENNCGISPESSLAVNVRTVPVFQGLILGSSKTCLGSNESYSVSFTDGFDYTWDLDSGGELSAQENSALINWNNDGEFQLSLSAQNSCGISEPIFKQIRIDSFPTQPNIVVRGDSLISNFERDNIWYLNGEVIENGDLPFIIPTETGQYTLQIINSCGESEISDFISFYGGDNLEDEIYLFPNPANTFVRIKIPLNLNLNSLRIINSEGRRVAGIDLDGNSILDLYIDYLRPGMYFVELDIKGLGSYFKKLVVN